MSLAKVQILITVLSMVSLSARADSTNPKDPHYLPPAINAKTLGPFFAKHPENCVLAIGLNHQDMPGAVAPIYCIWNGVAHEGTINEAKGCMIGKFEPGTGAWGLFNPYGGRSMVPESVNKDCSKTVIEAMLKYTTGDFGFSNGEKNGDKVTFAKMFKTDTTILYDKFGVFGEPAVATQEAPTSMLERARATLSNIGGK